MKQLHKLSGDAGILIGTWGLSAVLAYSLVAGENGVFVAGGSRHWNAVVTGVVLFLLLISTAISRKHHLKRDVEAALLSALCIAIAVVGIPVVEEMVVHSLNHSATIQWAAQYIFPCIVSATIALCACVLIEWS